MSTLINRRSLILGALAAPAIVKFNSLMPVKKIVNIHGQTIEEFLNSLNGPKHLEILINDKTFESFHLARLKVHDFIIEEGKTASIKFDPLADGQFSEFRFKFGKLGHRSQYDGAVLDTANSVLNYL